MDTVANCCMFNFFYLFLFTSYISRFTLKVLKATNYKGVGYGKIL